MISSNIKNTLKIVIPYMFISDKIVFVHAIANYVHSKGWYKASLFFESFLLSKYGCAISPLASLGKGIRFPHPIGVVIGAGVVIKDNVTIYQNTTIGRKLVDRPGCATIGSGTVVYSNCVIVGDIEIGEGCVVGAGSFLDKDMEAHTVYRGVRS